MRRLNDYLLTKVMIPQIRRGNEQEIETLIREEALLLGMYLRDEMQTWIPRIASLA